jgi:signal transduction histidine kinase
LKNFFESEKLFKANLEAARKMNYKKGEGQSLSKLALIYYLLGQYDKSTEYHLYAIEIFQKNNFLLELADEYGEFGYQLKRRDLPKANFYMQTAISIVEQIEDKGLITSKLYDNYAVLKEMEGKLDSALYFSNKSLENKIKLNDTIGIPYSLNKIAGIYALKKDFIQAFNFLSISDSFRERENSQFGIAENKMLRANFLKDQGKIDSALFYYFQTYKLAKSLNYNYLIASSLQNISDIYLLKKDFMKSLDYYKKYIVFKDSLENLEKNTRIVQLEISFETAQKDKLISEKLNEIKQRNLWLIIAAISLVLIISISIISYKLQKTRKEKEIKEIEYNNQLIKANLEKKILDEKLRISRELHDNIGSQLTFIISSIDNLIYKSGIVDKNISNIKDFSLSALYDLRNTIWSMKEKEGTLEKLFLKVNDLIQRLNPETLGINISVKNQLTDNYDLSSIQMLNLFRIIQEAVQNSIKHSSAKNIDIIFTQTENCPLIIIKDNGIGFDLAKIEEGNGLENMRIRAEQSNSKLNIISDNNGTTITISITN